MKVTVLFLASVGSAFLSTATAQLHLNSVFSDHMVLQRELPLPIWGTAKSGDKISVTLGTQTLTTTADTQGRWEVTLHGLEANKSPQSLQVESSTGESQTIRDILIGEVWLASGQSNMDWKVSASHSADKALPQSGSYPNIRLLKIPRKTSYHPLESTRCQWHIAEPEHSARFSVVAWHFAHQINQKLDIPVGIIQASWGGSRIEPWINTEGFQKNPSLRELHQFRKDRTPGTPEYKKAGEAYLDQLTNYTELYKKHLSSPELELPTPPLAPKTLELGNQTFGLYPAMIHPIVPFSVRGFLWYQGESNIHDGNLYYEKKRSLIQGWRSAFQRPNAPFYFVQIAPFRYNTSPTHLPEFWVTQQKCLRIPHTEMVVTNDLGDPKNIHPKNKSEVSRRLAMLALSKTYALGPMVRSPLYQNFQIQDNAILVHFQKDQALQSRDNKALTHFEIAAEDGTFYPAEAEILDNHSVKLTSPSITKPQQARFAWKQTAKPNLINAAALPAAAFHTHWPADPTVGKLVSRNKPYYCDAPNINGWSSGLTDGSWKSHTNHCFATNDAEQFPKSVTIDLEELHPVTAIKFGLPPFGSTKTIQVSLSRDGKKFNSIGQHSFPLKSNRRSHLMRCEATPARYVKFTFTENHSKEIEFSPFLCFLTEAEIYSR